MLGKKLLLAALLLPSPVFAAAPIAGAWRTQDGKAVVTIGACGAAQCGHVSQILKPEGPGPAVDRFNPDPKLRTRPILGMPILTGFTDNGNDWRGQIYDPEGGKTYKSIVSRLPDGRLKVQGCILFICRTLYWERAG